MAKILKLSSVFLAFFFFYFLGTAHASAAGYAYKGIAFYAFENNSATGTLPVYKFYSASRGDYSYTISESAKAKLIADPKKIYAYKGIAFYTYNNNSVANTLPVYQFWSSSRQDYYYTISESTKAKLIADPKKLYAYKGIAFYAYNDNSIANTLPVYQFWNASIQDYYYTISEDEKDKLMFATYGKEISVGLWSYSKNDLSSDAFQIEANKDYEIKDNTGKVLAKIAGNSLTKVKYAGNYKLRIYNSISDILVDREVQFESSDGNNLNLIFNVHRPNSTYDEYRGKIKLRYSDTSQKIWVINLLPLEQYVWGIGEITGTGDEDYNRTMTTAFRTYAYWKILYSTKYATEGFKVDGTPNNQIYRGYEWELAYPRIKDAAIYTQGKIAKYGSDIALSPYSSWTDGRTRSFEERWGSTDYPWCQSVKDSYGKNPTMTTSQLFAAGNHMVGISAHGALKLATDYGWDWNKILGYYLHDITIVKTY